MKICSKCNIEKPKTEFYKDKRKKEELYSSCIACKNKYQQENIKKIVEYKKQYYQENVEKILEKKKQYYKNNAVQIVKKRVIYSQKRLKNDPLFKFSSNVRSLIHHSFKRNKTRNYKKQLKTELLLGCTIAQLRDHLASKFQPGMTFENHGQWHIDHIIPLASAKTQEEIEKLCHYTNLQPLWASDNIKKGDNI